MAHSVQLWLERCTGFASRSGGRFVIEVVHNIHIHVGVCSAVYGTVHYKEPLKLFGKASQSNIHTADNSYLVGLWLISDRSSKKYRHI